MMYGNRPSIHMELYNVTCNNGMGSCEMFVMFRCDGVYQYIVAVMRMKFGTELYHKHTYVFPMRLSNQESQTWRDYEPVS